ncbi:hypothetical protein ES702_02759 [subsurface metagenome]
MKEIMKTRVMTKNFIIDFIANIHNMFGSRITSYENMLIKAKKEIWDEIRDEDLKMKWYRYEITQLTNGALVVMLYGDAL